MDQRIYTARAMQTPALVCSLPALSLMNNSTSAAALTSPAPGRRQHPSRIDSKHTVALGARALIAPRGGESGALERGAGGGSEGGRAAERERESGEWHMRCGAGGAGGEHDGGGGGGGVRAGREGLRRGRATKPPSPGCGPVGRRGFSWQS